MVSMPLMLWRYILVEICKVFILTTAILVVVIAFGAAIKPLAENLLGPLETAKYIFLATIPMMQFALPFSIGFACTLVMHRLASDNEVQAMVASGLSYFRIIVPVGLLGLVLTIVMLLMVNTIIPMFWLKMQETIAKDASTLFISTIQDGEAFHLGDTQIYADGIYEIDDFPGNGADRRFVLTGVAAVELDSTSKMSTEFTAEYATVDLYQLERDSMLKLAMVNATIYRGDDQALVFVPQAEPAAVALDGGFEQKPKFMTFTQLLDLPARMEELEFVAQARPPLINTLQSTVLWDCFGKSIELSGQLELVDPSAERRYIIYADRLVSGRLLPAEGQRWIRIIEFEKGKAMREANARSALLVLRFNDNGRPRLDLRVSASSVTDLRNPEAPATRWPAILTRLIPVDCPEVEYSNLSNGELITAATALEFGEYGPGKQAAIRIGSGIRTLQRLVEEVKDEIVARLTQRAAMSVTAVLLAMMGALLAIRYRHGQPLVIYMIAFLPAIISILLISSGEQSIKNDSIIMGSIIMWSGNAFMGCIIVYSYFKLARN